MRVAVVVFPGSNCDQDACHAVMALTGNPAIKVFHKDRLPAGIDMVILPGGFSYGDYLRCGAIARFSPVMQDVANFANSGGTVLGICNGFQILVESRLLPGALIRNRGLHFRCKQVHLRAERHDTRFTAFEQKVLQVPIAHATGNYFMGADDLRRLEDNGQVLFRYCSPAGELGEQWNPNGSVNHIAGVMNESGNVLGMMPHPERAIDPDLGSSDGAVMLRALFAADVSAAA